MAGLCPIGGAYLSFQTPIENGGAVGVILNNLEFVDGKINTNKMYNVTTWLSYVKEFLFNSTRLKPPFQNQTYQLNNYSGVSNPNLATSIMMCIWLATFVYLLYQLFIITVYQHLIDKRERKEISAIKVMRTRPMKSILGRTKSRKYIIRISMGLIYLLWFIFMILLCICQYLVSSKFFNTTTSTNTSSNSTNNSQRYDSIRDTVAMSFTYLNGFFNIITNQTNVFLASSLSTIATNTRSQIRSSVVAFGNQVLITFNITSLFYTAQMLIGNINQVVNSMTFINNNCQNILKEIDNTKGAVNVYQSNLATYLNNICPTISSQDLQNMCRLLEAKNKFFQVKIETGKVSSSSSVIMLFVLQQFNINISNIETSFKQIDSDFQTKLNVLYNNTVNQLNISSYLNLVTSLWTSLVDHISPTLSTVSTYNSSIISYLDDAAKYENIVIIILILLIILGVIVILTLFLRDKTLNRCLSLFLQSLFILVLFVSSVICIAILIVSNFSQSEICNQINTTGGTQVLDQMINVKFATPWNNLTGSLSSYNLVVNVTLAQPTNILSGIKDRCRNTSMGLFSVLGISDIVNVTQIVYSSSIMAMVTQAQNDSLKSFLDVNPQQIIPSNLTSFLSQISDLIKYFDGLDYIAGIQELKQPLTGLIEFNGFLEGLSSFALNASRINGWTNDLKYLNDTVAQLLAVAPNFAKTQNNTNNLAANFQILQNNRNNTFLLNQLTATITNVQNLFNNSDLLTSIFLSIYNNLITINLLNAVQQIISDGINKITYQILPCGNMSMVFEAISTTFCSNSNTNISLATFGIIFLIEIVFCQIIALILMAATSLRLNIEINVSKC